MDFTDIYRTLHPNATEYTFFSSAHGTSSRIDHILGYQSGLNQYQKIGIIPCIFSDHNALKLELNHKKKFGWNSNTWRLKSILLKDERVNQEIREELKRFFKTNENEDTTIQNLWDTTKAVLRGKYIAIQASLKNLEKTQIYKLTLHLKELEKEQQIKSTPGIPGWRSGLVPAFGPGRDPGDPGSNPTSGSRCMEPASPSACVSACLILLCLSWMNK